MLRHVTQQLAGDRVEHAPQEVLENVAEFRNHLVLDKLETPLDDRLRDFLRRLPLGSTVLSTSRTGMDVGVGIGTIEYLSNSRSSILPWIYPGRLSWRVADSNAWKSLWQHRAVIAWSCAVA